MEEILSYAKIVPAVNQVGLHHKENHLQEIRHSGYEDWYKLWQGTFKMHN
jgi:hypothetical protein